jgi:hypothetical protein
MWRRGVAREGAWRKAPLVGEVTTHSRQLHVPGPPIRDPAGLAASGFQGSEVIDPCLDLTARRRSRAWRPSSTCAARCASRTVVQQQSPQDESDILSLIFFGIPTNELGEGQQSPRQRAQELAGSYLASGLSKPIGGALNLDEFEIRRQGRTALARASRSVSR